MIFFKYYFLFFFFFFFFNDTATTEIYTLSLHDALPISDKPVSSGRNFRGCRTARTDGPDRLVRNQNTGELVRGQRARAARELPEENFFGEAGVAVFLRFTQTNDGSQAGIKRDQGFFGD